MWKRSLFGHIKFELKTLCHFLWHNLEFFSFDLPLNVCSVASLVMVCSYKIGIAFDNVRWHSRIKKLIVIQIGAYISLSIEWATLNSASFMTPMYGIESKAFAAVTTYGLDVFFRSWIHRSNIGFQTAFSLCHKSRKTLRSLSLSLSISTIALNPTAQIIGWITNENDLKHSMRHGRILKMVKWDSWGQVQSDAKTHLYTYL